jgi:hypothetical protein
MNTPPNSAPFDLVKALAGHPLITRDGKGISCSPFRRVSQYSGATFPYRVHLYNRRTDQDKSMTFTREGRYYGALDTDQDLFLLLPEKLNITCGTAPWNRDKLSRQAGEASGVEASVCADIAERQKKGIAKYGVTVAENPLELREWLQHAYEECLDQAVYLKRAMAELHERAKK